jgi:toxin ParE1/3/4
VKRVYIRPSADYDLDDIYVWIAADDPAAAARFVERLVSAARSLGDFPERGRSRAELGQGLRSLTIGHYLILYRISPRQVEILRFVHGARDLRGLNVRGPPLP